MRAAIREVISAGGESTNAEVPDEGGNQGGAPSKVLSVAIRRNQAQSSAINGLGSSAIKRNQAQSSAISVLGSSASSHKSSRRCPERDDPA